MKLALLAKGPTLAKYPGREGYDAAWGLNQLGQSHELDALFVMDDLELRLPYYNGPEFPEWLKGYKGRLITSRPYPDWPTSEAYPVVEVCQFFGVPFGVAMYSTVDWMLAYAVYIGVKHIDLYGVDCLEPKLEQMRNSISFWIGVAMSRGVRVTAKAGSFFRYWTDAGIALEQGCYGYVERPRIETLVARDKAA